MTRDLEARALAAALIAWADWADEQEAGDE